MSRLAIWIRRRSSYITLLTPSISAYFFLSSPPRLCFAGLSSSKLSSLMDSISPVALTLFAGDTLLIFPNCENFCISLSFMMTNSFSELEPKLTDSSEMLPESANNSCRSANFLDGFWNRGYLSALKPPGLPLTLPSLPLTMLSMLELFFPKPASVDFWLFFFICKRTCFDD